MSAREVADTAPPADLPSGEPIEVWEDVAAVGPSWQPPPKDLALPPVHGRIELYPSALVFRADDAVVYGSGAPLVGVIEASDVRDVGPLSPGSKITAAETAGQWMPRWQRRFRPPGFAIATPSGGWAFDCPKGTDRAAAVRKRYGPA